ncbi:hypothetical protein ACH4PU_00750 [Streptomyces sp. NPDC021100]|uniref:hypothetical protein n=1 Tax=Streptomyces sp. NPDC021100 TaxID=3365114 RepID=UPI00379430A9
MNRHTLARATGVVLALLAGAQAAAAPAWAGGPGGGVLTPVTGGGAGLPPPPALPLPSPLLQPLCAPAPAPVPAPAPAGAGPSLPALVNVGVQDIAVLSDAAPRTCTGGPAGRDLPPLDDVPFVSGIVAAGA